MGTTSNFRWPWQYDFPPFFTMQKNADTRFKQTEAWCSLILDYHNHHKLFRLRVTDVLASPLFYNKAIDRRLTKPDVIEILSILHKKGNIEWEDKEKTVCKVFWKTPAQWSDIIFKWVNQSGLNNTVCTLHEITNGPHSSDQEFYALDDQILMQAIQILQASGKAELMGTEGVKFFT
uniref:Vacuolar protein-sorting-associated protein 25 n=1 Tax=Ciona intestinalis TaxID=7719 RepID=H2XPG9_CIOIN|nr:vacuolar protein-sorting-associated protein 25 [Ciona intestinalis]|eukprot:XP_002126561.1 vacuolar protein-sorting-associated protein 25 [Ciona intestinalis]